MRDIMIELLEEASSVPPGAMDCIISQFENQADVSYSARLHALEPADKTEPQHARLPTNPRRLQQDPP
jgi:hypothetical protein